MNTSLKNQRFMRSWTLPIRPSRSATSRCNRELGKRFGDQAYAMEELVAELGAAFLCADLQITDEPRADHAQYLASWLSIMKEDKKAIGGRVPSRGFAPYYQVRAPAPSRAAADALCEKILRAGGACVALRS